MVRGYGFLVALLCFGSFSFASTVVQSFSWRADSRFELNLVQDNATKTLKGELRDGGSVEVKSAGLTVNLKSYVEGFVTVVASADVEDVSSVSVLERQNANYIVLNKQPILAKKSTVNQELSGSVDRLKVLNNWDASQSMRALISYFTSNPSKQISSFFDQVELGNIKLVAKPQPRAASAPPPPTDRAPEPQPTDRAPAPPADRLYGRPDTRYVPSDRQAEPPAPPLEADDYNQMELERNRPPQDPRYRRDPRLIPMPGLMPPPPRAMRQGNAYFDKYFPESE